VTLTIGSLFSGVGLLELGLEQAGFSPPLWQIERDDWCRSVLAKHWPEATRYDDVRTATNLRRVDVLCGGFPCQPFSLAGKRLAQADERHLWPEYARIIREVEPKAVIAH
jgi:DNA (cytosine-5)-methyltransferase 1